MLLAVFTLITTPRFSTLRVNLAATHAYERRLMGEVIITAL
jgi:hypothetical protein